MKNNAVYAARLSKLLKELRRSAEPAPAPQRTPLEHLIYAFLAWNTTRNQADQAFNRLKRASVDLNDLRVTDPVEIAEILGTRYSKASERAQRLVLVLRGVYQVEHAMEMERITAMPKREARSTLEQMPGMVPFVSASVLLFGLGAHAIPVDDQLVARLRADEVVDPEATIEQVQSFLEHNIRADDAVASHQLLRPYAERAVKVSLGSATGGRTTRKTAASTGSTTRKKKQPARKTGKAATEKTRSSKAKATGRTKTSKKTAKKKKTAARR